MWIGASGLNAGVCSDTYSYQWVQCMLTASQTIKPPPPACSAENMHRLVFTLDFSTPDTKYVCGTNTVFSNWRIIWMPHRMELFRLMFLKGKPWTQKLLWYNNLTQRLNECNPMSWPIPSLHNEVGICANMDSKHKHFKSSFIYVPVRQYWQYSNVSFRHLFFEFQLSTSSCCRCVS